MLRRALAHDEHVVSVFFDHQKAYDTVWKHGIMKDIHDLRLRGRLPSYINRFLSHRTFKAQINNKRSDTFQQVEGVPQRCVLSVTLFAIKINGIISNIPNDSRYHY